MTRVPSAPLAPTRQQKQLGVLKILTMLLLLVVLAAFLLTGFLVVAEPDCNRRFYQQCDGDEQCDDGSDESPDLCNSTFNCSADGRVSCLSGKKQCIYPSALCNGRIDCKDGSDESHDLCRNFNCSTAGSFSCLTGIPRCIPLDYVCNGERNCADGSDEAPNLCRSFNCSAHGDYQVSCPGGLQCINQWALCDGYKQCADGSDESPAFCSTFNCSLVDKVSCLGGLQCTYSEALCNGKVECNDGSDESPDFCAASYCSGMNEVSCPSGKAGCLLKPQLCDGKEDCTDGSDETPEFCGTYNCSDAAGVKVPHYERMTKCPGGEPLCIKQASLCDGRRNCKDGSDESHEFCSNFNCSAMSPEVVSCPGHQQCIFYNYLCDGKFDCLDGSDESPSFCSNFNCSDMIDTEWLKFDGIDRAILPFYLRVKCPALPNLRARPQCVYSSQLCNGDPNCPGESDEDNDFCAAHPPRLGYIKCREGEKTIHRQGSYCDGVQTCMGDESDEDPVFCANYSCPEGMVKCDDGLQCIHGRQQCNNLEECNDGSDESATTCNESFDCSATSRVPCPSGRYCMDDYCNVCNNGTTPASCPDNSDQLESNCHFWNKSVCISENEDPFQNRNQI